MYQPLTTLMRQTELLAYKSGFDKASREQCSYLRLGMTLCSFLLEFNYWDIDRKTPIESQIGETVEAFWEDARMIAEKVSNQPMVELYFIEAEGYTIESGVSVQPAFGFKSLKVLSKGATMVKYRKFDDKIVIRRPKVAIHNMMFGKTFLHQFGTYSAKNYKTGEVAEIHIKEKGLFGAADTNCTGTIKCPTGAVLLRFEGEYKTGIKIMSPGGECAYELKVAESAKKHEEFYRMPLVTRNTSFLNEDLLMSICPTDSRLRPDRIALENGDIEMAGKEKVRIDEMGAKREKELKKAKKEFEPRWFKKEHDEELGEDIWSYNRGYFEARKQGSWGKCPTVF